MAYAVRQDNTSKKGFPINADIYVSEEVDGNNFTLVGKSEGNKVTGSMVEFKFDTVKAKRIKFVFQKSNADWASGAEFWFYKEDKVMDKMENLFTDDSMS